MPSPAAGNLPKPLKGPPRQSFAPFCRFPSGASAKYRGRAAHAREQPQAEPAPVQFSLAHQRGAQALPSPAAGYLPKPLKGSPRQGFAPSCRFPSGASAKYRGRAAHAREQPQAKPAPVQFSLAHQRGAQALPSPAAGYLPKPLKGPPRQSFAPLARTAAGKACACSIQLGTPKGGGTGKACAPPFGVPAGNRTRNLQRRRLSLYPIALRTHMPPVRTFIIIADFSQKRKGFFAHPQKKLYIM